MLVNVTELQPGDMVDIPDHLVTGTDNEPINTFEFALIEQVGGGWADAAAPPDHVVIYTENFALPIICPAGLQLEVVGVTSEV